MDRSVWAAAKSGLPDEVPMRVLIAVLLCIACSISAGAEGAAVAKKKSDRLRVCVQRCDDHAVQCSMANPQEQSCRYGRDACAARCEGKKPPPPRRGPPP